MMSFENAFALIIGINDYQHVPPLRKAVNDATDMYQALIDPEICGYKKENVRRLLDGKATLKAVQAELKWLARQANEDSMVTLFFSGHGAQALPAGVNGNFVLLCDSNPWREGKLDVEQLERTALSGAALTAALRKIESQKLTVFFDACHAGGLANPRNPFYNRAYLQRGLAQQYYEALQAGSGRAIIASCKPDQVSWELADMRNGIFTAALLAGLKGAAAATEQGVSVLDLFRYLAQEVPSKAAAIIDPATGQPAEQNPYLKVELIDDYLIALSPQRRKEVTVATGEEAGPYDVFISYSRDDEQAVIALVNRLREDGFLVWLDEDEIGGGDPLVEVLVKGIEQSSYIMVCLSPSYLPSKWGVFEAAVVQTMDIDAQKRKLIPIRVGECEIPIKYSQLYCPNLTDPTRWDREYKKAIRNIELTRQRRKAQSKSHETADASLRRSSAEATRGEPELFIEFGDREQELNLIEQQLVGPSVKPYVYICAPAQMGKTFLLQELRRRYDGQKIEWPSKEINGSPPKEWRCAYVDLAERIDCRDREDRLIAAIVAALGDEPGATIHDLAKSLQKHREAEKKVLILLDSADRLSDSAAGFLPRLLRDLEKDHLRQPAYFPGFVAASRRSFQAWEQSYDPILRQIELTPFTETVVESLLKKAVRFRNQTYEPQWYRDRAAEIAQCSAGHPGCIAALIRHFYAEYFVTSNLNADEIFAQCVVPVIKNDILTEYNLMGGRVGADLDFARLARMLLELSTYRLITRPHVEAVARRLGLALSPEDIDILEEEVRACLLVERGREYDWPYMPYSLRRLLARWLELQQRNAAARHREAAAHYDAWLGYAEQSVARAPLTGDYQAAYICEALFHHALGQPESGPALLDHLIARLKAHAANLRPGYTGQRMADSLRSRMYRDKELRETVENRAGEGAYGKLLAVLDS